MELPGVTNRPSALLQPVRPLPSGWRGSKKPNSCYGPPVHHSCHMERQPDRFPHEALALLLLTGHSSALHPKKGFHSQALSLLLSTHQSSTGLLDGSPVQLALRSSSNSPASTSRIAGTTGMHHHAQLIFVFLVEIGFHHFGQDGLELLASRSTHFSLPKLIYLWFASKSSDTELDSNQKALWNLFTKKHLGKVDRTWWLTPVIPALWEAESLAVSPRLEYSGTILAHCNFFLTGICGARHKLQRAAFHRNQQKTTLEAETGELHEPRRQKLKQGFSMLVRLVLNSRPQVIRPPQPPKMLGLQIVVRNFFTGCAQWLKPVILALWEAKAGGSPEAWWRAPVVLATQEDEAGESLEPGRLRLQWAEIAPLHSSLGNKSETLSEKKKETLLKYTQPERKTKTEKT
ncbi:hypothetical protein AAY473_015797 [Plecturocebus cupreus]